jgi:hypothetical protein
MMAKSHQIGEINRTAHAAGPAATLILRGLLLLIAP